MNPTQKLIECVESFNHARLLIVGDVMLDRFIYGTVNRISPEAPVPVLHISHENVMLGGAGNVLRNAACLGATTHCVSVVGNDKVGKEILALCEDEAHAHTHIMQLNQRQSIEKIRYIADSQQLLRADNETIMALTAKEEAQLLAECNAHIAQCDALVLSDYNKGVLSNHNLRSLIALGKQHHIPVLIDPKKWDISLYAGATLLCPNEKEAEQLHGAKFENDAQMEQVIATWCKTYDIEYILVTRGAKGMMLVNGAGIISHINAKAHEVFDVSGAGDTVLATLSCAIARGASVADAAIIANHAAGIAVGRIGTATVPRTDIKTAIYTDALTTGSHKILSLDAAIEKTNEWKKQGLSVGFTNGCFDIVHRGHITSLSACKQHCDKLVLAINSDASVKRLKGDERPINNEMDRAMLLAALQVVDAIVIFREDTPEATLHALRPDVLMKGADYEKNQIVGWEFVESYGGRVERIALVDGYSTTNIINKLAANQ
jgi:D-beta-D-heptose 7-phosphate kinase / D-beta-D-heptose 1-phosphate adenosyltransferase